MVRRFMIAAALIGLGATGTCDAGGGKGSKGCGKGRKSDCNSSCYSYSHHDCCNTSSYCGGGGNYGCQGCGGHYGYQGQQGFGGHYGFQGQQGFGGHAGVGGQQGMGGMAAMNPPYQESQELIDARSRVEQQQLALQQAQQQLQQLQVAPPPRQFSGQYIGTPSGQPSLHPVGLDPQSTAGGFSGQYQQAPVSKIVNTNPQPQSQGAGGQPGYFGSPVPTSPDR